MPGIIKSKFKKEQQAEKPAEESKFKKILKLVFVHNIGYKLLAIGMAIGCWILVVCLN